MYAEKREHDEEKNFTCGKCSKAFKGKNAQLRHERNCNGEQQQQEQPFTSGRSITRKSIPASTQTTIRLERRRLCLQMQRLHGNSPLTKMMVWITRNCWQVPFLPSQTFDKNDTH